MRLNFTGPAGGGRAGSYHRRVRGYQVLRARQRLRGRAFTDPEHTLADAMVMDRMLARLRLQARSWADGLAPVELLEHTAGLRQWLVVPRPAVLLAASQVTAVGFFGDLRPGMDHAAIYQLEADIVERLSRYAAAGLLSYYDAELDPGVHGNLVLFGTAEVPPAWHGDVVHARAVALAPHHYRCIRLHRGLISGPFAGTGGLAVQRTRYFDFRTEAAWRGLRVTA
jgi:hypothetical protein